jgi:hypothetical protein
VYSFLKHPRGRGRGRRRRRRRRRGQNNKITPITCHTRFVFLEKRLNYHNCMMVRKQTCL